MYNEYQVTVESVVTMWFLIPRKLEGAVGYSRCPRPSRAGSAAQAALFFMKKNFPPRVWIIHLLLWISHMFPKYPQVVLQSAQQMGMVCNWLKLRVNRFFGLFGGLAVMLMNRSPALSRRRSG